MLFSKITRILSQQQYGNNFKTCFYFDWMVNTNIPKEEPTPNNDNIIDRQQ